MSVQHKGFREHLNEVRSQKLTHPSPLPLPGGEVNPPLAPPPPRRGS
ncbi:MAG: hypothetical protein F6K48_17075 [Okeania sp. SIO3H1]|nr:hypothetical protein [Okeania sp. SIO3H1]